jgi:hypothetical protein
MSILPCCNVLQFPFKSFSTCPDGKYLELIELIRDYVRQDCWAFVINNEILFNSYNAHSKTFKAILEEKIIRDTIIDNPQNILAEVNCRNINTKIEIYMFQLPESYKLVIIYDAALYKYIVYRINSQRFIDKFGEDNEI